MHSILLDKSHLPAYTDLVHGPTVPDERARLIARIEERLAENHPSTQNIVLSIDEKGVARSALRLMPYGATTWTLSRVLVRPDDVPPVDDLAAMITTLIEQARSLGATVVSTRLVPSPLNDAFGKALAATGFRRVGERIEYTAPLDTLPSDEGTPLRWRTMEETGLESAAEIMRQCSVGDPHSDQDEDPVAGLRELLSDPVLTSTPDTVQVGMIGNQPAAFVMAQVIPESGWSRIAYIGVMPEYRGRGLGRWAHRHGFDMMRQQGGREYHGGTAADNHAMIHLFQSHGCAEKQRMIEWEYRFTSS